MKPFMIYLTAFALLSGGCATSYQVGQTPDDVYYSPGQPAPSARQNNQVVQDNNGYAEVANSDETVGAGDNAYVTYDDGGTGGYDYSAYTDQSNLFSSPASLYSYNYYSSPYYDPFAYNFYGPSWGISPYYSWGISPYYSYGYGGYYSPFSSWYYPSFSLSIGWGIPWAYTGWGLGSYYGYGWGNPYWSGYYNGYYNGKYAYYTPRPAATIAPRRSFSSPATAAGRVVNTPATNAPRRVFRSTGVATDNNGRINANVRSSTDNANGARRVFRPSADERPVNINNERSNNAPVRQVEQPRRTEVYRPQPIQRSFETAAPRSSAPSSSGRAPVRTFSPRR